MNYKKIIAMMAKGAYDAGIITEKAYKQIISALGQKLGRRK